MGEVQGISLSLPASRVMTKIRTIGFFYEALNPASRSFLQMMCNDEFYQKQPEEAYAYLEYVAESAQL